MTTKVTSSDIYDTNRKTGALILGRNRLDDYATKYLTKHCKEALLKPMALPVEEILRVAGLTVQEVSLSRNLDIFGCCMLLDGEVEVYDKESGTSYFRTFPAGTVLVDPDSQAWYGEGARRNTLMHEALHWEKDKVFFEILALKNKDASDKLCPIMCRQTNTFYEPPENKKTKENEVKWLEWQAHRLAPRVLMPYEMFKKKALELIDSYACQNNLVDSLCDTLVQNLSEFFKTSRVSVKLRLIEVGLRETISKFSDFEPVFAEIDSHKEFVPLTALEAFKLVNADKTLQKWIKGGRFVFADGYFVLADSRYVTSKCGELHLTKQAKKDLSRCVLNFHEQKFTEYQNVNSDFNGSAVLFRGNGRDTSALTFHPKHQTDFKYDSDDAYKAYRDRLSDYDEEEEKELMKRIGDPSTTLCQCLWYLMEKRHWLYPERFSDETGLHKNYHGKIKNNKYNNMGKEVLMALCVGLRLSLRITEKLFNKSENKLNYYEDPDKTYIHIMEWMPGLGITDFNNILFHAGIKELGSSIKFKDGITI